MKYNKTSIYVDAYELLKILKRAQFSMTKADRIIYGTPVLEACTDFLSSFVMAYDFIEERDKYIKEMFARFEVLKLNLRIIVEENIIKVSNHEGCASPDSIKCSIFERVGKIDEGISRWRGSVKGKTAIV